MWIYHSSQNVPGLSLFRDGSFNDRFHAVALPAGGLGVQTFFVLSGFVLTWSHRPGDTARAFWRRRFWKIYPNYLTTWLLAMAMFALAMTSTWIAALNLTMLQPWVPNISVFFSVDMPSWSVGVEALFYALFPLLLVLCRRIADDRLKYWIGGVVAGSVAVPALLYALLPSTPHVDSYPVSQWQFFLAYVFPPSRLLDFVLGILVARVVMAGRWRDIGLAPAWLLYGASYVLALFVPYLYGLRATSILPIALVIAAAANRDVTGRRSVLRSRPMIWLGDLSYAFYLVQFLTYLGVRFGLGGAWDTPTALLVLLGDLILTILVAAAMHRFIERPLMRRFARPRPRRRRAEALAKEV